MVIVEEVKEWAVSTIVGSMEDKKEETGGVNGEYVHDVERKKESSRKWV